jgi:hypothetical protein
MPITQGTDYSNEITVDTRFRRSKGRLNEREKPTHPRNGTHTHETEALQLVSIAFN